MDYVQQALKVQNEIYKYTEQYPLLNIPYSLDMRSFAWDMKTAAVKNEHPEWSDLQVEDRVRELFLHART